jgi:hypothetical protein
MLAVLLGSPALLAQNERVITAEELRKFNPVTIESVQPQTATARLPSDATRRLRDLTVDRSTVASSVSRAPAGATTTPGEIRITPDQYVVLKTAEPARSLDCARSDLAKCTETPVRFLAMTPQGSPLNLALVLASTGTLHFDSRSDRFVGNVFVQLKDLDAPGEVKDIGSSIRVVVSADVDDIKPGPMVTIGKTNSFSDVTLEVSAPQDPTVVALTPERLAEPQAISLVVKRPTLQVEIGQSAILGFGLETAPVTVRSVGEPPAGAITLSSHIGRLDQNALSIDPATGIATTFIRSRGTGRDTVSASLSPFAPATGTIEYEKPWSWLIAVLLGVVVGIGIRLAMRARQQPPKPGVGFDVIIGIIGGVIVAVLYALGVNILPLQLPGGYSEALAFVLSALGGWVFPRWLEALGPKKAGGEA